MTPALPRADLLICHDCDAVYPRRTLGPCDIQRCRRCGATLGRGHFLPIDGQLALTVAAMIAFLIGSTAPIVTLELSGIRSAASVIEATRLTWEAGERLVAMLSVATAVVFPMVVIALRLWVMVPLTVRSVSP